MANAKAKKSIDEATQPIINILKKAHTKSLEGKATLGYHLGLDNTSALYWRIASNSGQGFFSSEWLEFSAIQKALEAWPNDKPITSIVLRTLFLGKSANNPSFLMATLVKEGILQAVPEKKRHYQIGDIKNFLTSVEELKTGHSNSGKPSTKAKGKAAPRITKSKKTPPKAK